MTPSIENAQRDARTIVAKTQQTLPNARFAIVQFRDEGDTPEYEVVQPLTRRRRGGRGRDRAAAADGGGDSPESYNLVFQRAVTDQAALGFRPGSRKLLFVLGDAEPHGAGRAGLAGCDDDSRDPHGLDTAAVLAGLRASEITLNLILQASSAQTSLRCYQSLAAAAYGNGTATESGEPGGGCARDCPPCAARPRRRRLRRRARGQAVPRVGRRPRTRLARADVRPRDRARVPGRLVGRARSASPPGSAARGRVSIVNRAPKAARLRAIIVTLPPGFRYAGGSSPGEPAIDGRRLTWTLDRTLRSGGRTALSFRLRAGTKPGRVRLAARFTMSDGGSFTARRRATLGVR